MKNIILVDELYISMKDIINQTIDSESKFIKNLKY